MYLIEPLRPLVNHRIPPVHSDPIGAIKLIRYASVYIGCAQYFSKVFSPYHGTREDNDRSVVRTSRQLNVCALNEQVFGCVCLLERQRIAIDLFLFYNDRELADSRTAVGSRWILLGEIERDLFAARERPEKGNNKDRDGKKNRRGMQILRSQLSCSGCM